MNTDINDAITRGTSDFIKYAPNGKYITQFVVNQYTADPTITYSSSGQYGTYADVDTKYVITTTVSTPRIYISITSPAAAYSKIATDETFANVLQYIIGTINPSVISGEPRPTTVFTSPTTSDSDNACAALTSIIEELVYISKSRLDSQQGGRRRIATNRKSSAAPKWLPTQRTVKHKGAVRKLWRSTKDAAVLAVKRIVKAADGSKKARFQRV